MRKSLTLIIPLLLFAFVACDQGTQITSQETDRIVQSESSFTMATDAGHKAIPGRFIVTLKPGNNPSAVASEFNVNPDYEYRTLLTGFAGNISDAARAGLLRDNRVVRVEQDGVVTISSTTQSNATWGLDRIDQRALPLDGNYVYVNDAIGVSAYILDTGIRYSHNEFTGRASFGYDAFGEDGNDCNGHGTHVAGTVGGSLYGVAKDVNLVAVRVLDCNGSGTWSGVIAGMDWVAQNISGPSVANMSLGGGSNQSIDDAIGRMYDAGVPTIVAAGNGNRGGREQDACDYSPAGAPKAYTIGATSSNDSKTSWSNYGDCVDMFAPGASITAAWYTSDKATNTISGTSMASPHVAGIAALFLQNNTSATSQEVYDAVTQASTKNIVTNSRTANNHMVYSLSSDDGGGGTTNEAPVASFTYSCTDLNCNFDASGSSDSDGSIESYAWDFGDGSAATGVTGSHSFGSEGTYTVTLTVTDNEGETGNDSQSVSVTDSSGGDTSNNPAIGSWSVSSYSTGPWRRADVSWNVSDADGDLDSVKVELLSGDTVLDSVTTTVSGGEASGTSALRSRSTPNGVRLTVTDSNGNSVSDSKVY